MRTNSSHIDFIIEIDKLKSIFRQSLITDESRRENTAEHSWYLAMGVTIFEKHSNFKNLDLLKATRMALIHDIVEIDAGDTFAYDTNANKDKFERERKAANRIYGLLENAQQQELKSLWLEFEERKTPEAKYVDAVDRFLPILLNYLTEGKQWKAHGVTSEMVLTRNNPIKEGSDFLWQLVNEIVEDALAKKYLLS